MQSNKDLNLDNPTAVPQPIIRQAPRAEFGRSRSRHNELGATHMEQAALDEAARHCAPQTSVRLPPPTLVDAGDPVQLLTKVGASRSSSTRRTPNRSPDGLRILVLRFRPTRVGGQAQSLPQGSNPASAQRHHAVDPGVGGALGRLTPVTWATNLHRAARADRWGSDPTAPLIGRGVCLIGSTVEPLGEKRWNPWERENRVVA